MLQKSFPLRNTSSWSLQSAPGVAGAGLANRLGGSWMEARAMLFCGCTVTGEQGPTPSPRPPALPYLDVEAAQGDVGAPRGAAQPELLVGCGLGPPLGRGGTFWGGPIPALERHTAQPHVALGLHHVCLEGDVARVLPASRGDHHRQRPPGTARDPSPPAPPPRIQPQPVFPLTTAMCWELLPSVWAAILSRERTMLLQAFSSFWDIHRMWSSTSMMLLAISTITSVSWGQQAALQRATTVPHRNTPIRAFPPQKHQAALGQAGDICRAHYLLDLVHVANKLLYHLGHIEDINHV